MSCECEACVRLRSLPGAQLKARWGFPGKVMHECTGLDTYAYFVWFFHRSLWWKQSSIGWPMDRRTHYLAKDARRRAKDR